MELRIKQIAKKRGYSMQELAEKLGITRDTLTRQSNGNPTLETLQKIAVALDVTVPELFAPQSANDFTAMIDYKGTMKRFNNPQELKTFLDSIK